MTSETAEYKTGQNSFDASEKESAAYFVAEEPGIYALGLALETGDHVYVDTESGDRYGLYETSTQSYALGQGERLDFTLITGAKGTLTITKESSLVELKEGKETRIPKGKTYIRFEANDCEYQITFSDTVKSFIRYYGSGINSSFTTYSSVKEIISYLGNEDSSVVYMMVETDKPVTLKVEKLHYEEQFLWDNVSWELNKGDVRIIQLYDDSDYYSSDYNIVVESNKPVKAECNRGSGWYGEQETSYTTYGEFKPGATYIRLTGLDDDTTVNLYAQRTAYVLNMTTGEADGYEIWDTSETFRFTPFVSGTYRFCVYGPERAVLRDINGNELTEATAEYDEEGELMTMYLNYDMNARDDVKLTVYYNDYAEQERYAYVSVNKETTVTLSSSNPEFSGSIRTGERVTVNFEPEESGTYNWQVQNNTPDSSLYVYSWLNDECYDAEIPYYYDDYEMASWSNKIQSGETQSVYLTWDNYEGYSSTGYFTIKVTQGEDELAKR